MVFWKNYKGNHWKTLKKLMNGSVEKLKEFFPMGSYEKQSVNEFLKTTLEEIRGGVFERILEVIIEAPIQGTLVLTV